MKRESGMLLDKVLDIFSDIFGKDIFLTEKQIAVEHMGFFKIIYRYLPLEYEIILENDRGVFSIEIYDNEGAHRNLYGIKKYNSATREENVKDAVQKLKDILEKDDFYFYINRGNKLYKKIDQCYKRVREEEIYRRK
jgi:hypothetical protein